MSKLTNVPRADFSSSAARQLQKNVFLKTPTWVIILFFCVASLERSIFEDKWRKIPTINFRLCKRSMTSRLRSSDFTERLRRRSDQLRSLRPDWVSLSAGKSSRKEHKSAIRIAKFYPKFRRANAPAKLGALPWPCAVDVSTKRER